jgi:hypothetical protein
MEKTVSWKIKPETLLTVMWVTHIQGVQIPGRGRLSRSEVFFLTPFRWIIRYSSEIGHDHFFPEPSRLIFAINVPFINQRYVTSVVWPIQRRKMTEKTQIVQRKISGTETRTKTLNSLILLYWVTMNYVQCNSYSCKSFLPVPRELSPCIRRLRMWLVPYFPQNVCKPLILYPKGKKKDFMSLMFRSRWLYESSFLSCATVFKRIPHAENLKGFGLLAS